MPAEFLLASLSDLTLDVIDRIAQAQVRIGFSPELRALITAGRARFEQHLAAQTGYIYGTTTAPGNRAKKELAADDQTAQGATLASFLTSRPGLASGRLPDRTVRLALLSRMVNALTGRGKLSMGTVDAICDMLNAAPPEVPLEGMAGPGEVMPLCWLLAPIADRPLLTGEAMALVNGSPFASAMVADVALTGRRQMQLAAYVFALSAEAARMPLGHCNPRLAEVWPDPFYAAALNDLNALLEGAATPRLPHQAPVAWRIIPNVMAVAARAVSEAGHVAEISMRSLKDNPTFIPDPIDPAHDIVVSSGGYNDHLAGRAIDTANAAWADLCTLAYRHVARLIGGTDLGLPHLLSTSKDDGVGVEYMAWTLTSSLERARQASIPAGLSISVEDPGGNQSDLCEPALVAYARYLVAAQALNECLGALALSAILALNVRPATLPHRLQGLVDGILPGGLQSNLAGASADPLRGVVARFCDHVAGDVLLELAPVPGSGVAG